MLKIMNESKKNVFIEKMDRINCMYIDLIEMEFSIDILAPLSISTKALVNV